MKNAFMGVLSLALLMGVFVASTPQQAAAEGFNVITSPLPIKISTQPGQTVTTELRIKNQGNAAEGIKVGLMKFAAHGEDGTPNIYDLTAKDSYASWVHFSPQQFTAPPNVWMSVTMTINVPTDAALGYYLAVTFSPTDQPNVPKATDLRGSAATLVLLDVKSANEQRQLELVSFTTDHKLYEYLPVNFEVRLHNTGNIYIAPAGNIFVNRGPQSLATLDFNAAGGSVLAGSYRVFNVPWSDGFPVFTQRLVNGKPIETKSGTQQNLKWDFTQLNHFRFGKYSARLLAVYDDGKQDVPIEAVVSFWVVPWKLLLVVLAIAALIGFGLFALGRSIFHGARSGVTKRRGHARKTAQ